MFAPPVLSPTSVRLVLFHRWQHLPYVKLKNPMAYCWYTGKGWLPLLRWGCVTNLLGSVMPNSLSASITTSLDEVSCHSKSSYSNSCSHATTFPLFHKFCPSHTHGHCLDSSANPNPEQNHARKLGHKEQLHLSQMYNTTVYDATYPVHQEVFACLISLVHFEHMFWKFILQVFILPQWAQVWITCAMCQPRCVYRTWVCRWWWWAFPCLAIGRQVIQVVELSVTDWCRK